MGNNSNQNAYDYFEDTFERIPDLAEIANKLSEEAKHIISPLNVEKSLLNKTT